jgi:hypothetical protein
MDAQEVEIESSTGRATPGITSMLAPLLDGRLAGTSRKGTVCRQDGILMQDAEVAELPRKMHSAPFVERAIAT